MIARYKEIFLGLLLGLLMWLADALMHTKITTPDGAHQPTFVEELFLPDSPQLITRLLFVGLALFLGALLWHSNQRERAVRKLERQIALFHEQIITPTDSILGECNELLRNGELAGEPLELVQEIQRHAQQIDGFTKYFARHAIFSPLNKKE